MKKLLGLCLLVLLGCGGKGAGGGGREPATEREARARSMDKSEGNADREHMKNQIDGWLEGYKREEADLTDKLGTSAKIALGEEQAQGQRGKDSYGQLVTKLRGVGINPKLVANPDFQNGFLQPDGKSYGDELVKVPVAKQTSTREAYSDFAYQTQNITWYAYQSSQHQILMQLQAVIVAASLKRNQKKYGIAQNDDDVLIMKKSLDYARRSDEIAAAGAGMSAALLAITNNKKQPKVLEDMAKAVKQSLPSKATATDAEAKAYLDGFEGGLGAAKQRYEGMIKASYGKEYDRSTIKSILDQTFEQAEESLSTKSQAERRAERDAQPNTVIPTRKPGAPGASPTSGLKDVLPADGPIGGALQVIDALKNGDPKGALKGALGFVPPGPIKAGLGAVLSLL